MKFYRYEFRLDQTGGVLALMEFILHKETPMGYWIIPEWADSGWYNVKRLKRWVLKKSLKRYAYPTKEEALTNYIERTKKRKMILKSQIISCETGLRIAENFKEKLLTIKS